MNRLLAPVTLITLTVFSAVAQAPQPPPGFDVASIKPSDPSSHGMQLGLTPGGDFMGRGVTLLALIQEAWDLRPFQVSGGPGWMTTERYDVVTKSTHGGLSEAQLVKMTQPERDAYREGLRAKVRLLLTERFQLKTHTDTKEVSVYALVIAKSGSKLQVAQDDGKPGSSLSMRRDDTGKSVATGSRLAIPSLVKLLSDQSGRMVLDQTGLTGNYDFKLTWVPDLTQRPPEAGAPESASVGSDGPSLFTALQEQLGLKLDSQKGPVQVLVIDSVQKPSEN